MIEILSLVVALGIYNVWILRFNKSTPYRGGDAQNMREEFAVYGLSELQMKLIGGLKLLFATLILLGFLWPTIGLIGAAGLAVLMAGAVAMHFKVKDTITKTLPALGMLASCLLLVLERSIL